MSPTEPVSRPCNIDFHADGREMIMHLKRLTDGDPAPSNVITDVNPSTVEPWDLPENMLYFNLEEPESQGEQNRVNITEGGYWELTVQDPIKSTSSTVGWRTTLHFFMGQAPHGEKTVWVMQKYEMERKGSSSLCRVFVSHDQSPNSVGSLGQAGARPDLLDSVLMDFVISEENDQNTHGPSNNSQVVSRSGHRQPRVSSNHLHNLRPDCRPFFEGHNFSREGCLGMSDLASSSSVSENTFIASSISDDHFDPMELLQLEAENISNSVQQNSDLFENIPHDYFDPTDLLQQLEDENMENIEEQHSDTMNLEYFNSDALLHELETQNLPNMQQQHSDCRFNVAACKGSKQVVIQPPPSGSLRSNNNIKNKKTDVSALAPKNLSVPNAAFHTSRKPQSNQIALKQPARTCKVNEANHGPLTLQGCTSNNVEQGRMTGGSLRSSSNLKNRENKVSALAPKNRSVLNAAPHTSRERQPNQRVPKQQPSMYEVNGANQGSSTLKGRTSNNAKGGRRTGSRIGKFVREYCCFLPI